MTQNETTRPEPAQTVQCNPAPAWVEHEPYPTETPVAGDAYVNNGVCRVLQDTQVNLTGSEYAWHSRTVQRVLTRAGAEQVAHFMVEFDPSCERLDVHFIRVVRGQECMAHAKPGTFQLLRRETNLERLVLDGRLTASLLVPDIRVGDIVEIGLTLSGGNAALGGKYSAWTVFDDFNPWLEARHRLLRPKTREISFRPFNDAPQRLSAVEKGGVEDSRWRLAGPKRREAEDFTPPWQIQVPFLQFSEFKSWADVVGLFEPLYAAPEASEALAEEIDRLAAAHPDPSERAVEWLRFVQRELRYFALSLGEGGYVPRPLDVIWSSRFGDCKDAAQLYVAGARRMGLDACAALTSTTLGRQLDRFLPGSNLFNHCIVRVRLNGRSYWLDPTMTVQSGNLANIYQPHSGWALPLAAGTDGLEPMGGDEPVHYLNSEDEIGFGSRKDSPARIRRQLEYYSWAADSVRNRFANEGTTDFARTLLKDVQTAWPEIVEVEPMTVADDPAGNCLTVVATYELPNPWKPMQKGRNLAFQLVDTTVTGELGLLKAVSRRTEVHLGRPRKVTRRTHMVMPRRWKGDGWHHGQSAQGVDCSDRLRIEGRRITHSKELTVEAWSAPAEEGAAYNRVVAVLNENQLSIWARPLFGRIFPTAGVLGSTRGMVGGAAMLVFAVLLLIRAVVFFFHGKGT